jgi:hypothetical protein
VTAAIPGATNAAQVEENGAASRRPLLSDEEQRLNDEVAPRHEVRTASALGRVWSRDRRFSVCRRYEVAGVGLVQASADDHPVTRDSTAATTSPGVGIAAISDATRRAFAAIVGSARARSFAAVTDSG